MQTRLRRACVCRLPCWSSLVRFTAAAAAAADHVRPRQPRCSRASQAVSLFGRMPSTQCAAWSCPAVSLSLSHLVFDSTTRETSNAPSETVIREEVLCASARARAQQINAADSLLVPRACAPQALEAAVPRLLPFTPEHWFRAVSAQSRLNAPFCDAFRRAHNTRRLSVFGSTLVDPSRSLSRSLSASERATESERFLRESDCSLSLSRSRLVPSQPSRFPLCSSALLQQRNIINIQYIQLSRSHYFNQIITSYTEEFEFKFDSWTIDTLHHK